MPDVGNLGRVSVNYDSVDMFSGDSHDTVKFANIGHRVIEFLDEDSALTHGFMTDIIKEVVVKQSNERPERRPTKDTRISKSMKSQPYHRWKIVLLTLMQSCP